MLARALALVVVLGGCRQLFGIDDTSVTGADARPDGPADAHHGSCGLLLNDDALRLCLELETIADSVAHDDSAYGNDATVIGATPAIRPGVRTTEYGITVGLLSSIHVEEAASLDLPGPLTIEMWVAPGAIPMDGRRMSFLDNELQYGLHLTSNRTVRCTIVVPEPNAGIESDQNTTLPLTEWSHVACAFGPSGKLVLYFNGLEVASADIAGPISIGSTLGVQIGQNLNADGTTDAAFEGSLDDVRIWAAALGPAELCAVAGPFQGATCPP